MLDALPRCHGCGAAVGERHDGVCDVARCLATGLQFDSCDHRAPAQVPHERDTWTGRWPGEEDCERLGWFARLEPGSGWVPCETGTPGAEPDINRLHEEAEWEPIAGRWQPKIKDSW
jgi:hypothetical protein